MNFTMTVGLPGNWSDNKGAKKFAHFAEPPVSENGMTNSTVLPSKFTSAKAGKVIEAAIAIPAARRLAILIFLNIKFSPEVYILVFRHRTGVTNQLSPA